MTVHMAEKKNCLHLEKKMGIDRNSDKVEITDADVIALVVSLSSLSTINRYLLPNNIQGQSVYIPETLTVSSGSQHSWNQFLVLLPNPICSTRIVPESKSDTDFQGVPHPDVCNIELMEIELSHTGPQDIQVPSMSSGNQVHVARVSSDNDITVPLEILSVTDYNQHTHSPSITYGNQISAKESSTVHDAVALSFHLPSETHNTHNACVQKDYYDNCLINAQDLGLRPIDDKKESQLNKSMDVSTLILFHGNKFE